MGSFFTGSGGQSTATAGKLKGGLISNLQSLMQPGAGKAQGLGAFTLDPAQFAKTGQALGQYSDPNYLDVASNPYTKNLIGSMQDASNTNLSSGLSQLRSQFAQAGQTSAGGASPLAQTEGQAITQSNKNFNDTLMQQLFQMLQNQQGLQLQGLSAQNAYNMTPADLIRQLAPLMAKSKGAVPSPLEGIGKLAGGLGGAAGALALL